MDEIFVQRVEQLVAARAGLRLRSRERETLRGVLASRIAALHLRHADEYRQLLQAETQDAASEWDQLLTRLTNNESYFFRDKGQMALLREHILPELIARNRARRTLRLWSAGCSTGEEPYSLAILVDELLPQRGRASGASWEIVILGTDIDGQALQQARRGIYGAWSFRAVTADVQQRSFQRGEDGWQVAESSRSLVTFERCNLVADSFPSVASGIHDMDLILCRNVFIYFEREAVFAVLPRFTRTLRDGGYLMTGHAETYGRQMEPLQARVFPESVVYQRVSEASLSVGATSGGLPAGAASERAAIVSGPNPAPPLKARLSPDKRLTPPPSVAPPASRRERAPEVAEAPLVSGDNPALPARTLPQELANDRAMLLQSHAQANLGHYEEATEGCRRLISAFPFSSEPYELLAFIAQEQGRRDEAKSLLKKALYLAPAAPSAYLELGALYHSESDSIRAQKMYAAALELLRQMPPEAVVGPFGGPTAQEWIGHLQPLLAEEK